jgi:hypothetical protein
MTCTTHTRSARTATRDGRAGQAGTAFTTGVASDAFVASLARAHEKEISFAEVVSAQEAPGGAQ